jgi:hypothetical protein
MKTPLEQLISYYKKEKKSLEKEIKESFKNKDYYLLSSLGNGLWMCEDALSELETIQHPLHNKIRRLEINLERLNQAKSNNIENKYFHFEDTFYVLTNEKELNPEISELRQQHLEICDAEISKTLFKIKDLKAQNHYLDANQHKTLSKEIDNLLAKKNQSIKLFQSDKRSQFIEIKRIKNSIQIKIIYSSNTENPFFINNWYVENLLKNGFHKPNSKPILTRTFFQNNASLKPLILKDLIEVIKQLKFNRNLNNNFQMKVS